MILRRKFIWLVILMVWVGLVTSIIVYQGDEQLAVENIAPTTGEVDNQNEESSENTEEDTKKDTEENIEENTEENQDINITRPEESENEDFFTEYRLERDKVRSEEINRYREMINSPNYGEAVKKKAQEKMIDLTEKMEKEMKIESLIRARGYEDALAYIHDNSVDVIVQGNNLNKKDINKIGDIIVKTTSLSFEDVTIIEKEEKAKK
ncbi:MAG: SpoIIIAH-like family protein [bacterium]